jgi:predicted DNA-binding transcriptional regulator AlpA
LKINEIQFGDLIARLLTKHRERAARAVAPPAEDGTTFHGGSQLNMLDAAGKRSLQIMTIAREAENAFHDGGVSPPRTSHTHQISTSTQQTLTREDEILTVAEVGHLLKMSSSQVYSLTRMRGQCRQDEPIPVLRIHRKALRFRKSDIVRWVERLAQVSTRERRQ